MNEGDELIFNALAKIFLFALVATAVVVFLPFVIIWFLVGKNWPRFFLTSIVLLIVGGIIGALVIVHEDTNAKAPAARYTAPTSARSAGTGITVPTATATAIAVTPAPAAIATQPARPSAPSPAAAATTPGGASPVPLVAWVAVANTGGEGVYVRRTPNMAERIVAWREGTKLEVIGPDVEGDGHQWKHVRDPKGNEGYVPMEYVIPSSP